MAEVLVDSNVLLDVVTEDPRWFGWSSDALARCAEEATLVVNPIIFAEVSIGFDRIEDLDDLTRAGSRRACRLAVGSGVPGGQGLREIPEARRAQGLDPARLLHRAHAAVAGMALLTRDATRYRTYFPDVRLIAPERA